MDLLVKLLAFVAVLGIIIFVHEFGHLLTAKAFGMRVFVFSFGFGRRLFGFKWGDTDCRVSAIPLGGYVKLEGEPGDLVSEDTSALGDGKDFLSRPRWQRFLVYLAGPVMNGVLAIGVMALLFTVGVMADATPFDRPILGAVDAGSPAERAEGSWGAFVWWRSRPSHWSPHPYGMRDASRRQWIPGHTIRRRDGGRSGPCASASLTGCGSPAPSL